MQDAATVAEMRRLYYGEHWKIGTIATQLQVHPDAIRRAINLSPGSPAPRPPRPRLIDPFLPWLKQTLATYPRLRATVLLRMLRERGYKGGVVHLRRLLRQLRPPAPSEAFLRLQCLPGEAGQVDWADFGAVQVGRAKRRLSAFVLTLSYSRALYAELFFDQSLSNFLTGHQHAFEYFGGVPRRLLSDNLRSVVLERRGDLVRFHLPLPRVGRPLLLSGSTLQPRARQRERPRRALHSLPARVVLGSSELHQPGRLQRPPPALDRRGCRRPALARRSLPASCRGLQHP